MIDIPRKTVYKVCSIKRAFCACDARFELAGIREAARQGADRMSDWNVLERQRARRGSRRAAAHAGGQGRGGLVMRSTLLERDPGARRPGLPRRRQPEAGRLPGPGAGRARPGTVHDLHMVQSVLASARAPRHLRAAASRSGSTSPIRARRRAPGIAQMLGGRIAIGAIHTYLELFGALFRRPDAATSRWSPAQRPSGRQPLHRARTPKTRRPSSRRPPSSNGIVIAQVNEIVDRVPRVDIPGDWVDFVVQAAKPHFIEPLFTRDPRRSPRSRS